MVRATILILSLLIVGCSSGGNEKDRIIPKSNETMKDIYQNGGRTEEGSIAYDQQFQSHQNELLKRGLLGPEQNTDIYRLNKVTTQSNFSKLHNPTIYLYFPPKLSEKDGMPIPAWMTEFKMYDRDEYVFGVSIKGERQ